MPKRNSLHPLSLIFLEGSEANPEPDQLIKMVALVRSWAKTRMDLHQAIGFGRGQALNS